MARKVTRAKTAAWTVAAWVVGFIIFFPILWMMLTSFKSELDAFAMPPQFLFFHWTTENYGVVQERSDYMLHAMNSIITAGGIYRDFGLLDTRFGLVVVLCLGNLPIVIWMLFTYFKEIPKDILEAARMDGATITKELLFVLTPMALPGIASTLLLNVILAWNEAFWTLNLSTSAAAPLTTFIASYSSPEGLFWAKLSAASTLAIAPILILGWFSQKQLVRGLTFGAVK